MKEKLPAPEELEREKFIQAEIERLREFAEREKKKPPEQSRIFVIPRGSAEEQEKWLRNYAEQSFEREKEYKKEQKLVQEEIEKIEREGITEDEKKEIARNRISRRKGLIF